MINDSFDLEKKAQNKHNMSTKPNMSPGNYHDAKVTKNLERIRSKRSNYKQKDPTTSERKKNIFILDDCEVKYAEGWKLSKNIDRQHKVCVRIHERLCQTYITENNMDNVIIHAGSNELDSERQADMIAKSFKYGAQSVN